MQKEHIIMLAVAGGAVLYFMSNSASAEEGGGEGGVGSGAGTINIRVGIPGGTLSVDGEEKAVVPANGLAQLTLAAPYAHSVKVVFSDGAVAERQIQVFEGTNPDVLINSPGDVAGKYYYQAKADQAAASGNTAEADAQIAFGAANLAAKEKRYAEARAGYQAIIDANNSTLVKAARLAVAVLDIQLKTGALIEGVK